MTSCLHNRCMDPRPSPRVFRRWEEVVCGQCGKAMLSTCWKERHSRHFSVLSTPRWGWALSCWCTVYFFRLISTLRCPLLRLDEGLHPKQDPADSDSAAAFRVGLHLWSCGSRCLLPLRGQISGRSEYFNISVLKCRSLTVLIVTMSLLDSL